ncbi:hypothetical protein C8R44DRAFT_856164 [Mycena epipterygia]|nr:hypothetical protein C8R44DRAFT_856164 [Mycena epipterygia]
MSTPTGAFDTHSSTAYRYAIVAALGVVALIGCGLFIRSRIMEHRQPSMRIVRNLGEAVQEKPRLYEAYLGSGDGWLADCEWGGVMPLSVYRIGRSSWPQNSTKRVSHDQEPLGSVPSKLAIFIGMPFSHMHTEGTRQQDSSGDVVPEEDPPLPYLEIGTADLDVPPQGDNLDSAE